jgi:hypothetical protein
MVQTLKCCGAVLEEEESSKPSNSGTTPVLGRFSNSKVYGADAEVLRRCLGGGRELQAQQQRRNTRTR